MEKCFKMDPATSDFINPRLILSKYKKNNPQKYFESPDILNTIVKSNEHLPSGIARLES